MPSIRFKSPFILCFVLVLLISGLLAACGDEPDSAAATPPPVAQSTPAAVEEQAGIESGESATGEGDTETPESEGNGSPQPATNTQTGDSQPQLTGEITLWHSWAGSEGDALAAILQDFRTRYPGVQVETLFVAHDDLLQSYAQAVFSEGGPTLILAPNWWLGEMVFLQLLAPFGPELAQTTLDGLQPAAIESLSWEGTLYGVPVHVTSPAVYINSTLYSGELPATLEDWATLAESDPRLGIGLYANLYHLAWGFDAYDVPLFDAQGRVILDEAPGAVNFLRWLQRIDNTPGSFVDQDYGMLVDRYRNQEFAFLVDGPWSYNDFAATFEGNLRVASLPAGPAGDASPWLYADGLFLNPHTDPATARIAVTFAQHLASPGAGQTLASIGGLVPANRLVELAPDHPAAGFHRQASTAAPMPTRQEMDAVWGYGGDMILRALLGYGDTADTEIDAALAELVAETSTLINEANGR